MSVRASGSAGDPAAGGPAAGDPAPEHPAREKPPAGRGPSSTTRRRARRALGLLTVAMALSVVARLVPVPYVVDRAGRAVDVLGSTATGSPIVDIRDAPTYPTSGALFLTTVAEQGGPGRDLSAWDWIGARLDPEAEIRPRAERYPPEATREAVTTANTVAMATSQENAAVVALRAAGHTVGEEVVVAAVQPGMPAEGRLATDDVLVAVDGTPVRAANDVARLVRQAAPGGSVRVRVRRADEEFVVPVPTRNVDGRAVLGISAHTRFSLPVRVSIAPGNVGGASAGLIFALGVYDKLTPGALLGGERIAGTGTVQSDGTLGPISGIRHKMVGAVRAQATWFLAPSANCPETVGGVPEGLTVVRVETFAQAKRAVEEIAAGRGAALRRCA